MNIQRCPSMSSTRYKRLPSGPRLHRGQQRCPSRLGSLEVGGDVIDVDEDTVDDPRGGSPGCGRVAVGSMQPRTLVVARGCRQHDQSMTCGHLTVREYTALVEPPLALLEAEGAR